MSPDQISYLTFIVVIIAALIFDLGLLSKKNTSVSIKKALYQTLFWVALSLAFCAFLFSSSEQVRVATDHRANTNQA